MKSELRLSFFIVLVVICMAGSARTAAADFILNGSFGSPAADSSWIADPGGTLFPIPFVVPTDWVGSADSSVNVNAPSTAAYPGGVPDGTQAVAVDAGSVYQNVPLSISLGSMYLLSVYVGDRADFSGSGEVDLETTSGTILVSSGTVTPAPGTFQLVSLTYTPVAGDPNIGQDLQVDLSYADGNQAQFNGASLTVVLPEPMGFAVLVIGAFGLLHRPRPRNRAVGRKAISGIDLEPIR